VVRRTAQGQGVTLEFDDALLEHLSAVGYRPEFGARELRRVIRSELETRLARAMLSQEVQEGDCVRVRWDRGQQKVAFDTVGRTGKTGRRTGKETAAAAE
jgi:ATP-dependent Clp protease ATP-binding subunit ClpC